MSVNILCIGDVVGRPGRSVLAEKLAGLVEERQIRFVVCNAENAAGGSGLTPQIFAKLRNYGIDVITLGDHVFRKKEIAETMESSDRIVRPANLSPRAAGKRWTIVPIKGTRTNVGVVCLLGQLYMGSNDSPWDAVDKAFAEMPASVKIRIVEMHAEATSEKIAMGWHLNGRASIVFGTHTHVATADYRVLDKGTAYISDVGMTGPHDGVLGRRKDRVLTALTTSMPAHFEVCTGDPRISGVMATIDEKTGRATAVERIEVCGGTEVDQPYDEDDGRPQHRKFK